MKKFEIDVSYCEEVKNSATITIEAKNEEEARKKLFANLVEGKDYLNKLKWDQDTDGGFEPEIDDVREVG